MPSESGPAKKTLKKEGDASATKLLEQPVHDMRELRLAAARLGPGPEDRLRWVVNFTSRDLDSLHREERIALGYDLRALIPADWSREVPFGPMPDADLREIQARIAKGLIASAADTWKLGGRMVLHRTFDDRTKLSRYHLTFEADAERDAILGGVAELLLRAGQRVRSCAECGKPFVARRRQEYCSSSCSQTMRTRRKSNRKKECQPTTKHQISVAERRAARRAQVGEAQAKARPKKRESGNS